MPGNEGPCAATFGGVSHRWSGAAISASLVRHSAAIRLASHHHPRATVTVLLGGTYAESLDGRVKFHHSFIGYVPALRSSQGWIGKCSSKRS